MHHYDVAVTVIVKLRVCQNLDSSFLRFGLYIFSFGLHNLVGQWTPRLNYTAMCNVKTTGTLSNVISTVKLTSPNKFNSKMSLY